MGGGMCVAGKHARADTSEIPMVDNRRGRPTSMMEVGVLHARKSSIVLCLCPPPVVLLCLGVVGVPLTSVTTGIHARSGANEKVCWTPGGMLLPLPDPRVWG